MIDREILEAIKAEIRKLKENPYFMMALKEVGVIDSSQEEPVSIDLEEAAKDYSWAINKQVEYTKKEITTDAEITEIDIKNAYIAGAKWQKEQMMKDAVYGDVLHAAIYPNQLKVINAEPLPKGYRSGDKVKIIIVKED